MINEIKKAIANEIKKLYPKANIYEETVSPDLKKGSFFISVTNQGYRHSLFKTCNVIVELNIVYFPENEEGKILELEGVKANLLRNLYRTGEFRLLTKRAQLMEDELHIQCKVNYKEARQESYVKINQFDINENMKEM